MSRYLFRGLFAHRARAAFTLLAVTLGVALIAGTFVLTDSISRSFDQLVAQNGENIDVEVISAQNEGGFTGEISYFPEAVEQRIARLDGVQSTVASIDGLPVTIVDDRGERVGPTTGAPTLLFSAAPPQFDAFAHQGRTPTNPGEIALSERIAKDAGIAIGDRVRVQGVGSVESFRVVGYVTFGGASSLAGAIFAVVPLADAQTLAGRPRQVDAVLVQGQPGVSPTNLESRVRAVAGGDVTVRTGAEARAQQSKDLSEMLSYLTLGLLVFGGVALLVGCFVIFNTFSITVAQRTQEFGMLRTIGASRNQILGSVVLEALVLGLIGSLLGLAAGIALAPLLSALMSSFGVDLPDEGAVIAARTVVVALVAGTTATVLSSLAPAVRATRVAPVEAMLGGTAAGSSRPTRRASLAKLAFTAVGVALMVAGLFAGVDASTSLSLLGAGAVIVFLGIGMLSPLFVGPLAAVVGRPMALAGGVAARIARGNSVRAPGRTAGTAASLMVGVALVAFVAIFVNGFTAAFSSAAEKTIVADFVVMDPTGLTPERVAADAARLPGVADATNFRAGTAKLPSGDRVTLAGLDPKAAPSMLRIDWSEGDDDTLRSLGPLDALVNEDWAKSHDLRVGSTVVLRNTRKDDVRVHIRGFYSDRGQLFGDVILPDATVRNTFDRPMVTGAFVALTPGTTEQAGRTQLETMLASAYPTLEPKTRDEFIDGQVGAVKQILYVFYVLLALAVVIALFGIVNTLALSVYERTRELGLLRAVGASRRQVRRIVRGEAVITSVIGAILGVIVGVLFGVLVSRPLADEGFVLSVPWGTLVVLLFLGVVAGVIAAIVPARRASNVDVLTAVTTQ